MNNLERDLIEALFPCLNGKVGRSLDVNAMALRWVEKFPEYNLSGEQDPFKEPGFFQSFIDNMHAEQMIDYSWGGYQEDRSFMHKNTYMKDSGNYLHAGVDISLPAGSPLIIPFRCKLLQTCSDYPVRWGWGPVLVLESEAAAAKDYYIIFAHLEQIQVSEGTTVNAGTELARIGRPPFNGDWWPHTHIQIIRKEYYQELKGDFALLDGYFHPRDLDKYTWLYPEPMAILAELAMAE